ncbi:unnamed protein product (macronuclear) [Paramecium tetraurelia]|uniref:Uncharacterized protein n=1 Tax=Paramecium tetraurelia TaxID=5888 RepID=A0DQH5_PARTE|nr:uncharacterized protein GSPATT00002692001 [Paramecium tetraurelia]CAK85292.1 unnamed protein product [Paramecium tetraurelia]|eukprot:XP_001452689.1 hypothetical protein (macronuclear) [Paramecium tetraurelia strain d4-2]
MNFIKGIFNKVVGTQQPLVEQEIFDFVILGTLFKEDEAKYTKLSSNTEFVFDKLSNDEFDHILIVRLQRASKPYNNAISSKEGDYYFNISFFKSICHSSLSDQVEEFSLDLVDIQGIKWNIRMHFLKNTKSDNLKIQNFKLFLSKLIWIQKNKKALPKNSAELNDVIPAKQSSKLEMHNLVQQKQMKKTLKKVDRSILSQPTTRTRQEKESIGDVINYFLQQDIDSIKQIYTGKLYVLYPELAEIRLINPLVVMALNIISKTECRMELYNQDRQLLLIQSLKDFISFEVDKDENYLSWVYFDGYNSIVIYFKFDVLDGATSMAFILQRSRINMKQKKNLQLDTSCSSISTATTININETQVQQIQQKKQKKYLYKDNLNTIKEGLKITKTKKIIHSENDNLIILEDKTISFIKNNKHIQINQQIKFDKSCLGHNSQKLILYQQFSQELQLINLGTETQEIVKLNFQIVDACSYEKQFILLSNSQVYVLNEDKTIQKINSIDQNLKDNYAIVRSSINGSIVIGSQQGFVFVFDNIKTMKQVNTFEGLGDPISDILLSADERFIIINNSQYIQFQQVITNLQNGYQQRLELKPFPIRVQLNPEDLILMGIFDYPNFQHVRIDNNNKVIAAQIENLQVIWNIEQIINQSHNSYQIFILPEETFDQQFRDEDLLILSESNIYVRECD